jgi:hypothetical protein
MHDAVKAPRRRSSNKRSLARRLVFVSGAGLLFLTCAQSPPPSGELLAAKTAVRFEQVAFSPELTVSQLRDVTPTGDLIRVTSSRGLPGELNITLTASSWASWFKQIRVVNSDGTSGPAVETVNQNNYSSMRLAGSAVHGLKLRFAKAGYLGIHADIFQIPDLDPFIGQNLTFSWLRDNLENPRSNGLLFCPNLAPVRLINIDGRTQWDGDQINAVSEPVPWAWTIGQIQFAIATKGDVSWRKELTLYSVYGRVISHVSVEGANRQSAPIITSLDQAWGGRLVFTKAKLFGISADVYEYRLDGTNLDKIGVRVGDRVVFEWRADHLAGCGQ